MQSDQYDDKPVFDMHTHTQKFIPEHYKGKKKVEAQVRSMDVWPRLEMLIYVYQYITMEGIVMNASERAHVKLPDYCSKWELPWIPRRARKGGDIE